MKVRDYRWGFDLWALGLFALIMIPNIVWFCVPAPNDVMRTENTGLDIAATVFQAISVAALVLIANKSRGKLNFFSLFSLLTLLCVIVYVAGWICYFCGKTHPVVLIFLAVLPCLAFVFFGLERKNYPALVPTAVFAILHIVSSCIKFL